MCLKFAHFIQTYFHKELYKEKNICTFFPPNSKQTITSERKFDFLKDLVANIPDVQQADEESGTDNIDISQPGPSSSSSASVKPATKKSTDPGHVPKKRGR